MALIKCLECGKEISDKATVCIHCGCPVSETETVCAKEEIDNDTTYCKACMNCGYIYWNPANSSYPEGYCSNCKCEREKRKLIKFDYTTVAFRKRVGDVPNSSGIYSYDQRKLKEFMKRRNGIERDLFEKYVSHWDTLDKECEEYKNNIKELYENSVTVDENETRLSNDEKLNIKMGVFIAFIVISILCFIILGTKGCSGETSHNDGKCDICNNAKYSSINGEEFCYEHYKNAIDYYLDD